jgi:hypothetical protein
MVYFGRLSMNSMGYMARQVDNEGANAMLVLHSPGCKVSMRLIGSLRNSPTGPIYIYSAHLIVIRARRGFFRRKETSTSRTATRG